MANACGENKTMVLTVQNLTHITTPGFPDLYPNNSDCQWLILAEDDKKIEISLRGHNLEDGYVNYNFTF